MKQFTAANLYAKQLDQVMKQDMEDLLVHEANEYDRGATRGTRLQPAYMQGDYFEEKREESELRRRKREYLERGGR